MRRARVLVHGKPAGLLAEVEPRRRYRFTYLEDYQGPPVSLTLPLTRKPYEFDAFPAFFDGLLPEGLQLEALLRQAKIDAGDYLTQLIAVGSDLVGAVTVEAISGQPEGEGT